MIQQEILPRKELYEASGDNRKKDRLLLKHLGITAPDLQRVRSLGTLDEKIRAGGRLLAARARGKIESSRISSLLTALNIAAVIYDRWDNPRDSFESTVMATLRRMYASNPYAQRHAVPRVHLLHKEIGAYSGNIGEVSAMYPLFTASGFDFLRSIRIPLELTPDVGFLVAALWSNGQLIYGRGHPNITYLIPDEDITVSKNSCKSEIGDHLVEMLSKEFNLFTRVNVVLNDDKRKGRVVDYGNGQVKHENDHVARITIASRAVCTWLRDDLGIYTMTGIPTVLDVDALFPSDDHLFYALSGVMLRSCHIDTTRKTPSACFYSNHASVKETVRTMMRNLGYDLKPRPEHSYIPSKILTELYERGLIINPRYRAAVERN